MHLPSAPARIVIAAWVFAAGGLAGCAQHRIPAIDPTGQNLFSGTTTVASHDWLHGLFHKHHQPQVVPVGPPVVAGPAVAAPAPVKPPCTPPVEAVPVVP